MFFRLADPLTIIAVYVDDLVLITKTEVKMQKVKRSLADQFKMKDLGKLHYCVLSGIEIRSLWLHQKQYIWRLIE